MSILTIDCRSLYFRKVVKLLCLSRLREGCPYCSKGPLEYGQCLTLNVCVMRRDQRDSSTCWLGDVSCYQITLRPLACKLAENKARQCLLRRWVTGSRRREAEGHAAKLCWVLDALLWWTNGEQNIQNLSSPFSSFPILISKKRSTCTRLSGSPNLQAHKAMIIFIPGNYDQLLWSPVRRSF